MTVSSSRTAWFFCSRSVSLIAWTPRSLLPRSPLVGMAAARGRRSAARQTRRDRAGWAGCVKRGLRRLRAKKVYSQCRCSGFFSGQHQEASRGWGCHSSSVGNFVVLQSSPRMCCSLTAAAPQVRKRRSAALLSGKRAPAIWSSHRRDWTSASINKARECSTCGTVVREEGCECKNES